MMDPQGKVEMQAQVEVTCDMMQIYTWVCNSMQQYAEKEYSKVFKSLQKYVKVLGNYQEKESTSKETGKYQKSTWKVSTY